MKSVCAGGLLLVSWFVLSCPLQADDRPNAEGVVFFEKKIRPLLIQHCHSCHSADAKKLRGELRLDTPEAILKGGSSGPLFVPGDLDKSPIIQAVRHADPLLRMPPKDKLAATEIADLEAWIKMGAPLPRTTATIGGDPLKGRDFWSLRPVKDYVPPTIKDTTWPLNAVDRFILAKLEEKGLKPVADADRRVLIRRVTFDLTGLPPTPQEIDDFVRASNAKPQAAYEALIDRLLASPHYGERWGRHWLDVVRYADTAGDNSDYPIPQLFHYRNWVIKAIQDDMPYDRFIHEQLAGDLLPSNNEADRQAQLIATGYLANARRFGSYEDARYPWHLTIEDTIDNLGRTFLGATINCCRCHDHKFDPFTQEDYYALYGFFQSTRYPRPGIELDKVQRDFVPLAPRDQVEAVDKERRDNLAKFDYVIKILERDKAEAEKENKDRAEELTKTIKGVRAAREVVEKARPPYETAYAVAEGKTEGKRKVGNACVQIKGDPERPGKEVPRRFLTVLGGQTLASDVAGSGRLELAHWITDPANPLTARVMVNRLWHFHFGKGIVSTPSDFGKQGQPPSHPELLDYLAKRFVESGWSLKAMHRLILTSRTYQLSSLDDPANEAIDVDNEHLWRFPRHRLDAESIRDAMLAVSGSLNRSVGGEHPFPKPTTWDFTQHKPFKAVYDSDRRSIYLMTQRIQRHPFLALFDGADTNASTAKRVTSTTPLQALYLMNDPFVHEQARKFAERLLAQKKEDGGRVTTAYLLAFGRPPTREEETAATEYLLKVRDKLLAAGVSAEQQPVRAWESLARVLFMSNEFIYVN